MSYIENKINEFIHLVKEEYSDISIGYSYSKDDDLYGIWHTYSQYHSEEFRRVIGKCIRVCFLENNIFNISIAYDIDNDSAVKRKYNFSQHIVQPNNVSFKMPERKQEGNYIIKRNNNFFYINRYVKINSPKQNIFLVNMQTDICKVFLGAA